MQYMCFAILFLFLSSASVDAQTHSKAPLEALSMVPFVESPTISPNGQLIAAITPDGNAQSVVVTPYGTLDFGRVVKLKDADDRIESIRWINDERLLVYTSYSKTVLAQKVRFYRLYSLNKDGSDLRTLEVAKILRNEFYSGINVLSMLNKDPEHILVSAYTDKDNNDPAVFKVNVYSGKFDKEISAVSGVSTWLADVNGNVQVGMKRKYNSSSKQVDVSIIYRKDTKTEDWDTIYQYEAGIGSFLNIISVIDDNTLAVSTDFGENQVVLREFDLRSKTFGKVIFKVEGYDLDSAITKDGKLVGYSYVDDFYRIKYFDEELAQRQALMQSTFKGFETFVISASKDKQRLIVGLASTDKPVRYYLVDLAAQKASAWLSQYPALEGLSLPGKTKIAITTKGGTALSGYFTSGAKAEKSPLIVLPHGGPRARDTQYFDIWVQLLARRGFAVLQVNFRGSEGFGNAFETAGYKQWGKLMQQDVYEAMDFVGKNALADTSNACIVGASYGGYVALTAGFQEPDRFKCVVSVNGIADIPEMLRKDGAWGGNSKATLRQLIGDVDVDTELADLNANSAINYVAKFTAPVLLIHSESDTRVSYTQGKAFYEALEEADKKAEYILLKDGTHFIDSPENREIAFTAIDKFVGRYLK
ncbi:alpha/beta fold hydrolase [Brumicola nitratireducens]|uniref:Peptidase S9, prolyl oligopeptidase active site region n=1 Tax=Glaciecola nitratireducens (strain JCM 12485 / KCTC 12276 / FR1064) TaxID=1085623 RepID=G4QF92_GLANF|nr:alpha/beta fold hydrolase [Glaciecola nitratireducens]AEP28436.1 peptidase S9, prolyl oligopeptidase active site region [Glaciecola nitratireducens FR1064]